MKRTTEVLHYYKLLVVCGCLLSSAAGVSYVDDFYGPGRNLKYLCRCKYSDKCESTDGACRKGDRCADGWFGPACQHRDVAFNATPSLLTDGDDSTCLSLGTEEYTIKLFNKVNFTWMSIVLNESVSYYTVLDVSFKASDSATVPASINQVYFSHKILEVHGSMEKRIEAVNLNWNNPMSVCSVKVNGGRHLGYRRKTAQSTDLAATTTSTFAADGKTKSTGGNFQCSRTGTAPTSFWTLNISQSVIVDRYRIYAKTDDAKSKCRLQYFHLLSSNDESTSVYKDASAKPKDMYDVYFERTMEVNFVNVTVSTSFWPGGKYTCNGETETQLELCEVEVFGGSHCSVGKWGRECENVCDYCKPPTKACYVATGICLSGCPLGRYGLGCTQKCTNGTWGSGCGHPCSEHCAGAGMCDTVNGKCFEGCKPGYKPDLCVEPIIIEVITAFIIMVAIWLVLLIICMLCCCCICFRRERRPRQVPQNPIDPMNLENDEPNGPETASNQDLTAKPDDDGFDQTEVQMHDNQQDPSSNPDKSGADDSQKDQDENPQKNQDPASQKNQDPTPQEKQDPTPQKKPDSTPQEKQEPTPQEKQDPTPQKKQDPTPQKKPDPTPQEKQDPTS